MTEIPTRWKTLFQDQVADAEERVTHAGEQLAEGRGEPALQAAYQAVVAAASVRVWLEHPPWESTLPQEELQRLARAAFPDQFAALAMLDIQDVLTGGWTAEAAGPYVEETRAFIRETRERLDAWLETI